MLEGRKALMNQERPLSIEEAVIQLRNSPSFKGAIEDAYLTGDVAADALRFSASAEFDEVRSLSWPLAGRAVLDVGAGTGIAAWAFAQAGARVVYAVEPDPSEHVGYGATRPLRADGRIRVIAAMAEKLPLRDGAVDVVYMRQVLHHVSDLHNALKECARVLKPGGMLLATREHVAENQEELREFLVAHPIHTLAGGENALPLSEYLEAISSSGLTVSRVIGPWDSVINAYPTVRSADELLAYPSRVLTDRFGWAGGMIGKWRVGRWLVRRRLRPVPGRMYAFLARKDSLQA